MNLQRTLPVLNGGILGTNVTGWLGEFVNKNSLYGPLELTIEVRTEL